MNATASKIQNQVRLPMGVALGVVLQGIRIRFGRSLVTIMGVVLGIAFLMAMLTSQIASRGVGREEDLRAEVRRMVNFLAAEIGPVRGKTIAVVRGGKLSEAEERFLRRLAEDGAVLVGGNKSAAAPAAVFAGPLDKDEAPRLIREGWAILASTRPEPAALLSSLHLKGTTVTSLQRELRPEQVEGLAAARRREQFRSGWIVVISLLVTVIGIANAMLMSVTERFREIGTMKCLGALSAFVRQMFLLESILIGVAGATAGALLGAAFSVVVYGAIYGFGLVLGSLEWAPLGLYLLGSVAAGVVLSVVAALYPAQLAAHMVPATALRSNF
jgi:hypothetical protein